MQILQQMIVIFLVMVLGYAAKYWGLMDEQFNKKLSALVMNITMPAMIFASVATCESLPGTKEILTILVVACISYAFLILAAWLIPPLLRSPRNQSGVFRFILTFGNVGYVGFPVVSAIFGSEAVLYAAIFNIPFNILLFTVGIDFIAPERQKFSLKKIVTPCLIISVISAAVALLKIPIPAIIGETADLAGRLSTPAALLIVGATLADMPIKSLAGTVRIYIVSVLKLLVLPVILWLCLKNFVSDPLLLGVAVVISGMPTATNGVLMCFEYGGEQDTMAQGFFFITLLSIVTIPIISLLPYGV